MDSDALQADVMRFMAIIAFCLIAVLALVRQIEPVAAEAPQAEASRTGTPPTLPRLAPIAAPMSLAPPAVPNKTERLPEPRPAVADDASVVATPLPEAPPVREPTEPVTAPAAVAEVAVPPPAHVDAVAAEATTSLPAAESTGPVVEPVAESDDRPADAGLILRFATDQDFLRLVAKGDIRVFLFGAERSFRLRSDYRFVPATTPRQLFEVMPSTVPALIRRQAAALPESTTLSYGLQFPERIERQLDDYLAQVESGALLIDRFGHVSHVSTEH